MKTNKINLIFNKVKLFQIFNNQKSVIKWLIHSFLLISLISLTGCFTDTIDTFDTLIIQVPLQVELNQMGNSDTTIQLEYLNDYPEYRENKDRIKKIKLYQSAFWIEDLEPLKLDEKFKSLDYYFEIGPKRYHIASYTNITVRDFYKYPHIDQIPDSVAQEISDRLLMDEFFTTYLIIEREVGSTTYFNLINSKVVVDVRIEVSL